MEWKEMILKRVINPGPGVTDRWESEQGIWSFSIIERKEDLLFKLEQRYSLWYGCQYAVSKSASLKVVRLKTILLGLLLSLPETIAPRAVAQNLPGYRGVNITHDKSWWGELGESVRYIKTEYGYMNSPALESLPIDINLVTELDGGVLQPILMDAVH